MKKIPVTGIDSFVAEYRSRALTLLFDFGAHPRTPSSSCRRRTRCSVGTLAVGGGRARRVRGYVPDADGGLPYRADYDIPFPGGASAARGITLRIHAECASTSACDLADRIVGTIEIDPDR
jgi:hypothetical protein